MFLVKGSEADGRSGAQVLWGAAEGAGIVQAGEELLSGHLIALYNTLKGGCGEVGVGLCSQVTSAGQGVMASSCARGGSGWMLGTISSPEEWSGAGMGCPGSG